MENSKQDPRLLVAAIISAPNPLRMLLTRHVGNIHTGFFVNPPPWYFPYGDVFSLPLVYTLHQSLKDYIGEIQAQIDERNPQLTEFVDPLGKARHVLTVHFTVSLPVSAQLVPRKGFELAWFPLDSHKDPSFRANARPSTVEIFRRLDADNT